jgi:1-acyl-sn-glycerol-3-phosphate acyltransferase
MSVQQQPAPRRGSSSLALDELRASVAELRAQLERCLGSRSQPSAEPPDAPGGVVAWLGQRLEELSLVELYDGMRRRLFSTERTNTSQSIDEFGLDPESLESARLLLDFLYDTWWRVRAVGVKGVPDKGPVLFVANRSGVLPYDGLMIAHAVEREHPTRRRPRFLVADWLATLPFAQPLLARLGGVRACPENAERLLANGHWVVAFPEGQRGALKPYHERYKLQRFGRGGFVSLAVRRRAVLVPVAVTGAEEVHPILALPPLTRQLLGFPLPLTPTFPLMGPLGLVPLPSQWRIRFGDPISFGDVARERHDDPLYINRIREQVRSTIQSLLESER